MIWCAGFPALFFLHAWHRKEEGATLVIACSSYLTSVGSTGVAEKKMGEANNKSKNL